MAFSRQKRSSSLHECEDECITVGTVVRQRPSLRRKSWPGMGGFVTQKSFTDLTAGVNSDSDCSSHDSSPVAQVCGIFSIDTLKRFDKKYAGPKVETSILA